MADPKRKAYLVRASFHETAPPNTIPFPKQANMTVAEILAFFPNCINCADVIYRMISNGGSRKAIHAIINAHRDLEAEWSINCCGEAMYKTMEKAGYAQWTVKKHNNWHESRKASWDGSRLDVGVLRTFPGGPAGTVSFRKLAESVRTMPEGDDALDLTRMVQYCVQNDEDGWRYPNDYEELLELLGGPKQVREANTDRAVFSRWEDRKAPPPLPRPTQPQQSIEVFGELKKLRRISSAVRRKTDKVTRSRNLSPGLGGVVKRRAARVSERRIAESASPGFRSESEESTGTGTAYVRALPEYVPPPPGVTVSPTLSTLTRAIRAEDFAGDSDPYSAYGFGGPRRTPPFRHLDQIELPRPWDITGWAENLRWAFEQRVLFAKEHPGAARWNESPQHMACIERQRTQLVWASDELLTFLEGIE
ncbi:hypothetical protein C7974DRAFT_424587 [Boeremia exigua]|uniref:uncharacterized protein n=1 Tax=Boeremia exigua TaxID=749465 RepID=UPI001E8ED887|nr:uncharacterized protein C7974DRAFT_424587 [Boeremia exigua]KAH6629565.1 hypothetical protein C7974DRAFT_424587 [Boeremia exigua]